MDPELQAELRRSLTGMPVTAWQYECTDQGRQSDLHAKLGGNAKHVFVLRDGDFLFAGPLL